MVGNWRETSVAKYGFKSTKYSARIPGQITSTPYTSGPEAPVPSNSLHKTSFCRADSGDGSRLTRTSIVGSKAANGGQVKTGQRMWPGTQMFYAVVCILGKPIRST